jgi:8-oxo-dGTP pyrophosphatase MutT (NUDIX family)
MKPEKPLALLDRLEAQLKRPKPGLAAQLRMAPDPRPGQKTYEEVLDLCRPAAVLVLIYPRRGRPHLVLTRRTSRVDHHRDQISLPGGEKDEGETTVKAALREAAEELGVRADAVRVLGDLTPLYIPASNYCIFPVVAVTEKRPDFRPAPDEVAEVIEMPLGLLRAPGIARREVWTLHGRRTVVPFYFYRGHKIWGATAMILAELVEVMESAKPEGHKTTDPQSK